MKARFLNCNCSFCDKSSGEVETIISAPQNKAFICDKCVDLCVTIVIDRRTEKLAMPQGLFLEAATALKNSGATRLEAERVLKPEIHDVLEEVFGSTRPSRIKKLAPLSQFEYTAIEKLLLSNIRRGCSS